MQIRDTCGPNGARHKQRMVRCTRCRFLFEPPTPGLLPDCRQCGGATMQVHKLEAFDDVRSSPPTLKFAAVKVESGAG